MGAERRFDSAQDHAERRQGLQSKESAETVSWPCRACGHHTRFLSTETRKSQRMIIFVSVPKLQESGVRRIFYFSVFRVSVLFLKAVNSSTIREMTTLAKTRNALGIELTDLHIHLGGAVAPHTLWSLAHQQGFKLPVENYWKFVEFITIDPDKIHSLD